MVQTRTRAEGPARREIAEESLSIPRGSRFLRYLLVGLDAIAAITAWGLMSIVAAADGARTQLVSSLMIAGLTVVQIAIFNVLGLYRARVCSLRVVEYARIARGCLILAFCALAVAALQHSLLTPGEIAVWVSATFLLAVILRSGYRAWLTDCRRSGRYQRSILVVGAGAEASEMTALLATHPELGFHTAAIVGEGPEAGGTGLADLPYAHLDDAVEVMGKIRATGALICAGDLPSEELNRIVRDLLDAGAHVQLTSGLRGVDIGRIRPAALAHEPLFYVEPMTLAAWQLAVKRALDLVLASMMIVLTAPILLVAAIIIRLQDRGPVMFKQERVGRHGAMFTLYKLRTMRVGSEHTTALILELNVRDGPLMKVPNDPRVTWFGRILRATSIDELPQLWNVLNGTMSLVGPRPALPDEVARFDAELRARESVPPGLTGLWQVEGRDNPSFSAYRRFDLFYLQNWSVGLDIMILLSTVESVFVRIFRGLRHLDEDIQLAPPEVRDPANAARRRRERTSR